MVFNALKSHIQSWDSYLAILTYQEVTELISEPHFLDKVISSDFKDRGYRDMIIDHYFPIINSSTTPSIIIVTVYRSYLDLLNFDERTGFARIQYNNDGVIYPLLNAHFTLEIINATKISSFRSSDKVPVQFLFYDKCPYKFGGIIKPINE